MKYKSTIFLVAKMITIIFLMVMSFILGVSFTKTADIDPIEQTKVNISTLLEYQGIAEFKNITYFFNKKMQNRRSNLSQTDLSSPPKIENMLLNHRG